MPNFDFAFNIHQNLIELYLIALACEWCFTGPTTYRQTTKRNNNNNNKNTHIHFFQFGSKATRYSAKRWFLIIISFFFSILILIFVYLKIVDNFIFSV